MIIVLMLLCAFVTAAAIVWSFAGQGVNVGGRVMRYASTPSVVVDAPQAHRSVRLPRRWETFLARAGVEWTLGQALFVAGVYGMIGLAAGTLAHLPIFGFIAGVGVLLVKLKLDQGKRVRRMAEQLPDALMLMATAIRSGLGFQQALQMVADEGPAPLNGEFARFASDLALGLSMDEALVRLQSKLGSVDGEMLASALLVQRQTGGNLSEILVNLHNTIRDRQTILGQVRAVTAQGRMSGMVLTGIPVFLTVVLYAINPKYVGTLFTDPRGQMMAAVGAVLMVIGGLAIRKIVNITL